MLTVVRWLLFSVSAVGVVATAEHLARRATSAGDLRFTATGALSVAIAVAEVLLLGTVGLGGNGILIATFAVAGFVVVRSVVAATGPTSRELARDGWVRLSRPGRLALGAAAAMTISDGVYLMFRNAIGTDGLISHLAEPAMWVASGHTGTMHPTISGFPIQAYPKTGEVLFAWAVGTARTPAVIPLIMLGGLVLIAAGAWSILRRLEVEAWVAAAIAGSLALCPIIVTQAAGPNTDLFTLTWILSTGALCLGSLRESGLLPVALVSGGVAVGTRTTAIPVVIVLLAVTLWVRRREVWRLRIPMLLSTATTLGVGVVWYVQDLAVYQAPFYPFSSLPSGPPVPHVIAALDATFLHDPRGAIRVAHVTGYAHALGAGLALGLGVVVALVLLPTVTDRGLRRLLAIGVVASITEAAIWSVTPYTGYSGIPAAGAVYVLAGTRYLLPGLAIFAITVGLASRANGPLGYAAKVLAVAGVLTDLWALHRFQLGIRPHAAALLAAAIIGAIVAFHHSQQVGGEQAAWSPLARGLVAGSAAIAVIATGTAATHGYLDRHIVLVRQLGIDEPNVFARLQREPQWARGDVPVFTGPVADALLAGPTFNHPLTVITQSTPCATIRAASAWLILPAKPVVGTVPGAPRYDRITCLAGRTPLFEADGLAVFSPRLP